MRKEMMCEMSDTVLLKLQKDIEEIKSALLGNEYNPAGGILTRLGVSEAERDRLQCELDTVRKRVDKLIYMATGFGLGAGILGGSLAKWLSEIIIAATVG